MTVTSGTSRFRSASRRRRGRCGAATLIGAAAVAVLAGCSGASPLADAVCGDGEYPVMTVGSTGSACVRNGEKPPKGYTRYPEGKVPQKVDDKWDVYWRTHTVDEKGDIVKVPGKK